jgi:DNA-binding transcriptional regulator YdaS (Cro superfamily)
MSYGKQLLDRAAAKAGSRYALAKLTDISQGNMSEVASGKRHVPASWILKLARIAEIDPTEAMEHWDLERSELKKKRRQWSSSAAAGVGATWLTIASMQLAGSYEVSATVRAAINSLYIVSNRLRRFWHLHPVPYTASNCR